MLFNSLSFALFLPIVFFAYWLIGGKSAKRQNIILLMASLIFYCLADWKFSLLLALSALINYSLGIAIHRYLGKKRQLPLFYAGLVFNIGLLVYFKYLNFFIDSFVKLFNNLGAEIQFTPFHILLPLGISFFTFQMIGYLIDIYNEEIEPEKDLLVMGTYLAYFPKILSGPIERAQAFIPQITRTRTFDAQLAYNGLQQILWGLFKKVVVASNTAAIVNEIFASPSSYGAFTLTLGACLYLIQLYADFSGYSDMAVGISKLFNIRITNNFNFPFFATNISEFWQRWHISLTTWMMDYVFTPLSFILRDKKKIGLILSILVTFLIVGIWHGDNATFLAFGTLQGLYFLPLILQNKLNRKMNPSLQTPKVKFINAIKTLGLFLLLSLTAVLLNTNDLTHALSYYNGFLGDLRFDMSVITGSSEQLLMSLLGVGALLFMLGNDYMAMKQKKEFPHFSKAHAFVVFLAICFAGAFQDYSSFIYFRF